MSCTVFHLFLVLYSILFSLFSLFSAPLHLLFLSRYYFLNFPFFTHSFITLFLFILHYHFSISFQQPVSLPISNALFLFTCHFLFNALFLSTLQFTFLSSNLFFTFPFFPLLFMMIMWWCWQWRWWGWWWWWWGWRCSWSWSCWRWWRWGWRCVLS